MDGIVELQAVHALLLGLLYLMAFLVGTAEVLRDNTAQTLLPSGLEHGRQRGLVSLA